MKTFNEWAEEKQLLNELSPELLNRAADAAHERGDTLNMNRAGKFSKLADKRINEKFMFPIVIKMKGTMQITNCVVRRIEPNHEGFVLILTQDRPLYFFPERRSLVRASNGPDGDERYEMDRRSARDTIDKINQVFGQQIGYGAMPQFR
jgi:hypothetical protein